MNKIVIVTGGRNYQDKERVFRALDCERPMLVVTGGAKGADELAGRWVEQQGNPDVELRVYFADWETHGRAAGPKRNRRMLLAHPEAIVLAFPGGRGTANCVQQARELGMTVIEVVSGPPGVI